MANVNIKFNNKDYLLSCDDGQEQNLKELASHLNSKYSELTQLCIQKCHLHVCSLCLLHKGNISSTTSFKYGSRRLGPSSFSPGTRTKPPVLMIPPLISIKYTILAIQLFVPEYSFLNITNPPNLLVSVVVDSEYRPFKRVCMIRMHFSKCYIYHKIKIIHLEFPDYWSLGV